MTAVIYARYSSDNQREESIEGQIRECTAYAEKNGITVVKHYIDRALSAKTDNRPDFQQMIKDSEKRLFDIVLVWKLDRFARNRYDSAHYEYQLERNHVKLVSATEPISDSPAGIMVKSMLTGMAEYYSAELSEKVVRGMTENVLKGKYNGGTIPIGFKVDEEKFFQIDPLKAPFVVEAFRRYNEGATMKELMNWLNDSGVTTNRNQKFTYNSVQTLLTNKRYIGENHFKDIVMPDSIPAIVDKDLFEEVQQKIKKNSRAPARHKAEDDYLLTTKLFCGMCGAMMFGECGTGRNKVVHHYYKCATAKRFKTCKKKTVRKEWLEDLVIAETMKLIQDDAVIDAIVAEVMELQDQENTTLPLLEKQMREVENGIENMLNAIQAGVLTNSTKSRLEKLEAQQKELEIRIAEEKIARPRLSENQVRFWLTRFRKLDPNVKSHRETLINTFVNAVYLYDEKVLITFNYKDGTKTITFDEIAAKDAPEGNGSDLGCFAPPRERSCRNTRAFFFCTNSKLTQAGGFEQHRPPLSVPAAKKPLRGFFRCAARAIHPRPPRTPVSEPGLEFRNVYRDSGTCRNKVSRAWCSWRSKKLFVSENKSAPGCSSLEEELSGGCYWMHFIFAGAFSSGHCSRMFPAFCPGPDTRRGCRRSVWLCRGRAFRSRPAGSRPHHRRRPAPKTDHGCPAG